MAFINALNFKLRSGRQYNTGRKQRGQNLSKEAEK